MQSTAASNSLDGQRSVSQRHSGGERERERGKRGREAGGGASSGVEERREERGRSERRMSTELLAGVWQS